MSHSHLDFRYQAPVPKQHPTQLEAAQEMEEATLPHTGDISLPCYRAPHVHKTSIRACLNDLSSDRIDRTYCTYHRHNT